MLGILSQDSYKYSHFLQLPEGITRSVSYIEARGYDKNGVIPEGEEIVFCGINGFIKNVMSKPITYEQVNKMEMLSKAHGIPFNKQGFLNIIKEYNGYLPVIIEALPEGTLVKPGVPMVQVYNIDDKYAWITSFIETQLLQAIWYPTTVATLSRSIKKLIKEYLEKTSDNIDGLPFKLHDFGQRGASSMESAAIGGAAHLINFMGTDTMAAIEYLYDLYGDVYGFSIPASEHSTVCSWGRENEGKFFKHMLDTFGTGLVACVSDTYNIYEACEKLWGTELKSKIETMGGTIVVRPDSGEPVKVTLEVIEILGEKFGYTINSKGYKVLPNYIRIIQGDGIDLTSIENILDNYELNGWSADNIAFGMGGALLQKVNRDTLKFAMKGCEVTINGKYIPIYKDPITDPGKSSKKGMQYVLKDENGNFYSKSREDYTDTEYRTSYLVEMYNPILLVFGLGDTFEDVRERAKV